MFNLAAGTGNEEDKLPERFLTTPMKEGYSKDRVVPLEPMLVAYYKVRDWDERGVPTKEKLKQLKITFNHAY